jgi:photosystem II stability/assembly factor-like uncharacterized protein
MPTSSMTASRSSSNTESPSPPPASTDPPTPSPSPTFTPRSNPDPDPTTTNVGDWVYLEDFPYLSALEIADAIGTSAGFVAIGTQFGRPDATVGDWFQGAVWTSADGVNWEHSAPETFASAKLSDIIEWNDNLYIVGAAGNCIPHAGCDPVPENAGTNVWRSSDGIDWELLPQSANLRSAWIEDVVAIDDTLVAVGASVDEASAPLGRAGVWVSHDGLAWETAEAPGGPRITTVAGDATSLVAFAGEVGEAPVAWQSTDGGMTWEEVAIASRDDCFPQDAIAVDGGFLAIGSGRRTVDEVVACVLTTDPSRSEWRGRLLLDYQWRWMRKIVSTPTGLVAIGAHYKPGTTEVESASVLLSSDGTNWDEVAQLLELREHFGFIQAAAAGPRGIVVFGAVSQDVGEAKPGQQNLRAWFAPLAE